VPARCFARINWLNAKSVSQYLRLPKVCTAASAETTRSMLCACWLISPLWMRVWLTSTRLVTTSEAITSSKRNMSRLRIDTIRNMSNHSVQTRRDRLQAGPVETR
jgi:citrate lyase beta subunit